VEKMEFERSMGMSYATAQQHGRIFTQRELCEALKISDDFLYNTYLINSSTKLRMRKGTYVNSTFKALIVDFIRPFVPWPLLQPIVNLPRHARLV